MGCCVDGWVYNPVSRREEACTRCDRGQFRKAQIAAYKPEVSRPQRDEPECQTCGDEHVVWVSRDRSVLCPRCRAPGARAWRAGEYRPERYPPELDDD